MVASVVESTINNPSHGYRRFLQVTQDTFFKIQIFSGSIHSEDLLTSLVEEQAFLCHFSPILF